MEFATVAPRSHLEASWSLPQPHRSLPKAPQEPQGSLPEATWRPLAGFPWHPGGFLESSQTRESDKPGTNTVKGPAKLPEDDSDVLLVGALTSQRNGAKDSLRRHRLSLNICRVRRQMRKRVYNKKCARIITSGKAHNTYRSRKRPNVSYLKEADCSQRISDPEAMSILLTEFCSSLYDSSKNMSTSAAQRHRGIEA